MTKLIFILSIIIICGCEEQRLDTPENYSCTSEELELVKKEFEICDQSSYMSSYCFLQAKKTICSPLNKKEKEND
jgi:hypothetical protein